jgi:ABC-2 type transport system permease protein
MLGITWRTQRRAAGLWVLVLGVSLIGTAAGVAGLYDTPAKIHTYAVAVTSGRALLAINGRTEGIDSLGGVIQDEFGFLAAFLLPLLGIALVARATRREEESGRLELLLGGRIARQHPVLAALLLTTATIAATVAVFAGGLVAYRVPVPGALLYSVSLGALAFVFAGLAALLAQLTVHARGVYAWALTVLAISYVLRGVGDATDTWVVWLSPLGWAEKAAAFGAQRWWVLALPLVAGVALSAGAVSIAAHRDLGSSLVRSGPGPARARAGLASPTGLALVVHRPATVGWLAGAVLLTGMMGALSQQLLTAVAGNPALAQALGMGRSRALDGFVSVTQLYLAIIATGYVVSAVGSLRAEEAAGRVETRLAGTLSRTRWLGTHALVILGGLVLIVVGSSLVLCLTTAASVGSFSESGAILGSGLAYLPVELVLAGLALLLYGVRPRLLPLAWAGFAVMTFIALLGSGLQLPQWLLDVSPTTHLGNPPLGPVDLAAAVVMTAISAALVGTGVHAFGRRGIPEA